jgi:hypothetical protein
MAELQIISESLPMRCEICHQADRFDAAKNLCSRCQNLIAEKALRSFQILNVINNVLIHSAILFIGLFSGLFFAFLFGFGSSLISLNNCSSHCPSIFHYFHLFIPITVMAIGFIFGLHLVFRFDLQIVYREIKRAFYHLLISIVVGMVVGALSGYLYDMRNSPVYFSPYKRAYLGAAFGLQLAVLVGVLIQCLIILVRLIDNKIRSSSKSK